MARSRIEQVMELIGGIVIYVSIYTKGFEDAKYSPFLRLESEFTN